MKVQKYYIREKLNYLKHPEMLITLNKLRVGWGLVGSLPSVAK